LETENKELKDKNISTIKELEEKKILIKELEFGKEKLLFEWKEKEKEFNKKGKDDIIKDEEYENLRAKIQDLEKELEKERETRKHLEVALASRISEAAKQQSSIDRLIKERDESVALTDDLELKLKAMEEENSYLRMEIKVFEENKRTKDSSDEKIKIISGLFSNLEKEIQKIVELCHNGEESKEMEALKSQLKEIKHEQCMEDIGDNLERTIKMLKYVSKEIIELSEKHAIAQQQIEKDTTKYKELEAKKGELVQRLEVTEANALKLNKQNQKLFKEKQIIASELEQREKELKEVKLKIGLLEKEKVIFYQLYKLTVF